jgi:hypothetical protein
MGLEVILARKDQLPDFFFSSAAANRRGSIPDSMSLISSEPGSQIAG